MAVFEDIESINFPSGSAAIAGCQEASVEASGDEIEHSECDDDAIKYRGLTNLSATGSATIEAGTSLLRDVFGFTFAGTSYPDVLSAELTESGTDNSDASDADLWITVIQITRRMLEATITLRDLLAAGPDNGPSLGDVGDLVVKAKVGGVSDGLTDATSVTFTLSDMELVSYNATGRHADFADAVLTFKSTNLAKEFTGGELGGVHVGDSGEFSFVVGKTEHPSGASNATVSLDPAVVTEKTASLNQGEVIEESLSVRAYSTDGTTKPISVT